MEPWYFQTAREGSVKVYYTAFIRLTNVEMETSHSDFVLHLFGLVLSTLTLKRVVVYVTACFLCYYLSYNVIKCVVLYIENCV